MEIRTLLWLATVVLQNVLDAAAFSCRSRLIHSSQNIQCSTTFAVRRPRVDVPDFTIMDDENDREVVDESDGTENSNTWNEQVITDDSEDTELRSDRSSKSDRGPRREEASGRKRSPLKTASWMQRNKAFTNDDSEGRDDRFAGAADRNVENTSFRQNFRGTRVFVTGLPDDVTWQILKDHFRQAGEVVFASVSADMETGKSKGYGVVQYETTHEALKAIEIMRDFPLNGSQLCKTFR